MIRINGKKSGLTHCFVCGKELYTSNFTCKDEDCGSRVYGTRAYEELQKIFLQAIENENNFISLSEAWYSQHKLPYPGSLIHKRTRKFNLS
ncbi:hypothetical protein A2Z67_05125 [Candidatus Woesebacteria bacterium RBG_13_36_22]|uniref:Uncharacterized protein n=1 Tax=Candidatus Woesebacteria bacterium RBG_13_36_22 TaxID=1802478 RepID=A0A1F7X2H2_9BACT|nr:MAG: hypothetical protein A2Z67_05125 [Candidatus Woesebacteria bacterium RBG_13_36_22]